MDATGYADTVPAAAWAGWGVPRRAATPSRSAVNPRARGRITRFAVPSAAINRLLRAALGGLLVDDLIGGPPAVTSVGGT